MSRWLALLLAVLMIGTIAAWSARRVALANPSDVALDLAVEPVDIIVDSERLTAALFTSPWVSAGQEGPALWVIASRGCAACVGYLRAEAPSLIAVGADVRVVMFAPADATAEERAVLAEIGARRQWSTLRAYVEGTAADYYAPGRFPPAADPVRAAIVTAGRRTAAEVEAVMEANGYEVVYPLLFWRTGAGGWRVVVGDSTRGRRAVRQALVQATGD